MTSTHTDPCNENCQLIIVVVNYFSAEQTIELINSLSHSILPNIKISIICSDNSNDKAEREKLTTYKRSQSKLDLIFNTRNLGFGAAINQATSSYKMDYLLLVNPDVNLNDDTLLELITHAQSQPKQGIWGGITLLNDGQPDFRHAWREPTLLRTLSWALGFRRFFSTNQTLDNYKNISENRNKPYPVDSISGCCMLISDDAWKKTSGFDEQFFLYSEELDLCKRARLAGFQPTVTPRATLKHAISYTADNRWRLEALYNSKFLYAQKHHHVTYVLLYRFITALGALTRSLFFFITGCQTTSQSWFIIFCNSFKKANTADQGSSST